MTAPPALDASARGALPVFPRRRIAVVVQRYGPGVLGGAEGLAHALVAALKPHHDITVLTSCALDTSTWAMHFAPGSESLEGIQVRRFPHPQRNEGGRARVPLVHKLRRALRHVFDSLGLARVAAPSGRAAQDGALFLQRQGPACAGLLELLRREPDAYDALVFFTALYHPTAEGLPLWGRRSVLIPTLHDEKPMYLPCFHRVFAAAGEVLYNTAAEQRLARRMYGHSAPAGQVVGASLQVRPPSDAQMRAVRARYALPPTYLVCVGRIEKGKGCAELLAAWLAVQPAPGEAALVFVGKGSMPVPTSAQVRATGFVSDDDRDALIAGAAVLVVPSRYESLSLVLLEAWALGVPVLVNGRCEVLADHLSACAAGEVYRGQRALRDGLRHALARTAEQRRQLGELGRRHVAANYSRENVTGRWLAAIEQVCSPQPIAPGR